jgi:hypothetical protein
MSRPEIPEDLRAEENLEHARLFITGARWRTSDVLLTPPVMTVLYVVELIRRMTPQNTGDGPGRSSDRGSSSTESAQRYCVMPDLTKGLRSFDSSGGYFESRSWLKEVKSIGNRQFWDQTIMLEMARQHLTGCARDCFQYYEEEIQTWEDFEEKFKENFEDHRTVTEKFEEMKNREQQPNERVQEYFYSKMKMCKNLKLSFAECKKFVLAGLRAKETGRVLLPIRHVDERELLRDLREQEEATWCKRSGSAGLGTEQKPTMKCNICKKIGHVSRKYYVNKNGKSEQRSNSSKKEVFNGERGSQVERRVHEQKCYNFHEIGHYLRQCPKKKPPAEEESDRVIKVVETTEDKVVSPNLKFYNDVKVNDVCVKAYVDFGSRICIIQDDVISTCKLNCDWGKMLR